MGELEKLLAQDSSTQTESDDISDDGAQAGDIVIDGYGPEARTDLADSEDGSLDEEAIHDMDDEEQEDEDEDEDEDADSSHGEADMADADESDDEEDDKRRKQK